MFYQELYSLSHTPPNLLLRPANFVKLKTYKELPATFSKAAIAKVRKVGLCEKMGKQFHLLISH